MADFILKSEEKLIENFRIKTQSGVGQLGPTVYWLGVEVGWVLLGDLFRGLFPQRILLLFKAFICVFVRVETGGF